MAQRVLYQTLGDRGNTNDVERCAPYECTREDAWLGRGFYFWDTFIELAHLWGKCSYKNNYYICSVRCEYNNDDILDLVGNTEQISDLRRIATLLEAVYGKPLTIPFVIAYLRSKTTFTYKMIRAESQDTFSALVSFRRFFIEGRRPYLNLCPAIQCCVLDKSILKLPIKIVFPQDYCEGCF